MLQKSLKFLDDIVGAIALMFHINAFAVQFIEQADQRHQQVEISAKEQNRLAVEGRRIAHVVPSRKGLLSVIKDEKLGVLYFALSQTHQENETATLFVSDELGISYKLILVPKNIAGEEIILKPPKVKEVLKATEQQTMSYQERIKKKMLLMLHNHPNSAVEKIVINKILPLWKPGQLSLQSKYLAKDLVGEKYLLKNDSAVTQHFSEQNFFLPEIQAIALEHHVLEPGDSTLIFIVRPRAFYD